MTPVKAIIPTLGTFNAPAGVTVTGFRVRALQNGSLVQQTTIPAGAAPLEATLTLGPGTYEIRAHAVDAGGTIVGTEVSTSLTVPNVNPQPVPAAVQASLL